MPPPFRELEKAPGDLIYFYLGDGVLLVWVARLGVCAFVLVAMIIVRISLERDMPEFFSNSFSRLRVVSSRTALITYSLLGRKTELGRMAFPFGLS